MVDDGVAYPVTSSEWGTPLVVIPKQQGVRLCGDFKVTLNQVIQHEHYPLPQPDDIFAALSGCQFFSVLDLQSAYLQMPVAESSQELLTLTTHKGLFRLRRLPFGLSSAPALFQAAMDKILSGLSGMVAYLDDVIVGGSSRQEAYSRLELVLQRLSDYGVKVNESKCNFLQSQVEYLGYRLSAEGISPQVGILDAIRNAPEPTNKDELRAYIGLINYYGRSIPNLSAKLSCFYDLIKKDVSWKWTKQCSDVFQLSKTWVCDSHILVHYDVNKPLVLTCDASPRGVGAVLSHIIDGEERPIAFASKSLSSSEKNYSQLHREALALVFGAKKFHKYIYGRMNVILQTDHQPLTAIFGSKKGIPSLAAARLQRWALILSTYNFEVRYRKGSEVSHADALSRLPLPMDESLELEANCVAHVEECLEVFNCQLVSENPLTSVDVARFTGRDPLLSRVRDFLWHGWRDVKDPKLTPYLKRKDELSIEANCVLWGSRVVIPDKLRDNVLRLLHDQHPGIVRMKMLARSYVWWPGLEPAIESMVRSCHICQSSRNSSVKVPLQQWPKSTRRWQRVHIDFAEEPTSRQQMLVLVDTYSRWIEVFLMNSTTTSSTVSRLRTLFASYGLPEELVSDNQATFTSSEFREFLAKNGVKFTLTPPYHPASNGSAERSVQIVKKNLLRQVLGESATGSITLQHKLDNFLISYRNTPCSVTGLTPAEMFLNWKPRTKLTLFKPNLQETIHRQMDRQKKYADRSRGKFRSFEEGELVLVRTVRNEKVSWVPGKILQKRSPVTYIVSSLGCTRVCHADHLRTREYSLQEEEPTVPPIQSCYTPGTPARRNVNEKPASPEKQSPQKKSTSDEPPVAELPPPVVQCSPPQLRRSDRTVKKPARLDL
ncbi:uncharacterized protein K02A2.6-like [Macrosteles quadrilineatus]|uniref:uncharacterized protein K02A2.6-like n=1 Tax=Macrosteles quadrilineatus TaxID=74068 RepID=UPI0023E193AB|nr:uncharacterized protein K02A2.6-like [Macrosteles quadrilineatus]